MSLYFLFDALCLYYDKEMLSNVDGSHKVVYRLYNEASAFSVEKTLLSLAWEIFSRTKDGSVMTVSHAYFILQTSPASSFSDHTLT